MALLLFFRVDDFDAALQRARGLVSRFEEEPHLNPGPKTMELSLRDPDGYYVTIKLTRCGVISNSKCNMKQDAPNISLQTDVSDTFDGDLIRPLGLVTLYFAYAEGELDELLEVLSVREPFDGAKRQWPVGQKLGHAQQLLRALEAEELAALDTILDEARQLFDRRNTIVHGRIYAGGHLVSNRHNAPKRITPHELAELAKLIFACKERIFVNRCKYVQPFLARGNA